MSNNRKRIKNALTVIQILELALLVSKSIKNQNNMERKVGTVTFEKGVRETEKPIELTHIKSVQGWQAITYQSLFVNPENKIVHLGFCRTDGDCFAVYKDGYIHFFKGHLNSGKY